MLHRGPVLELATSWAWLSETKDLINNQPTLLYFPRD